MQRLRHLERAADLLAFLGDAARDVADRARHRLAAAAQRARRIGERVELLADAIHRLEQRPSQIVDVQRGRELVREAPDERNLLRRVRVRLVVLQLEEAHGALAEPQRDHDDAASERAAASTRGSRSVSETRMTSPSCSASLRSVAELTVGSRAADRE